MSPEQIMGTDIDHRSDIYSLGMMAYEMLTGTRVFPGKSLHVLHSHMNTPAPPFPPESDCPPDLEQLVLRMLAKAPEDRPRSMHVVAEDLASIAGFTPA